eukprot:15474954-Alexandrium_andersonii.AAC.1
MTSRELLHAFEVFVAQERRWWSLAEQGVGAKVARLRTECRSFLSWDTRASAPPGGDQEGAGVVYADTKAIRDR